MAAAKTIISTSIVVPYGDHKSKWHFCKRCPLCSIRKSVVLARGHIPAPILFIGEAPGESEDAIGRPFIGAAGQLLDRYITEVQHKIGFFKYAITNTVGCWPRDENGNTRRPTKAEIQSCSPRLAEFVYLCQPLCYIFLGQVAGSIKKSLPEKPSESLIHPAAILYQQSSKAILSEKRFLHGLESFLKKLQQSYPQQHILTQFP